MASIVGTIPKPVRLVEGKTLRVGNTRVSLDSVVYAFNEGMDAAETQYNFDTLTLAEIHGAISYYLHNKAEVDKYLEHLRAEYERVRAENHANNPHRLKCEILLAHKNGNNKIQLPNEIFSRQKSKYSERSARPNDIIAVNQFLVFKFSN